jgi:hypothetical protein
MRGKKTKKNKFPLYNFTPFCLYKFSHMLGYQHFNDKVHQNATHCTKTKRDPDKKMYKKKQKHTSLFFTGFKYHHV